ncbi:unnamed protein product [Lampetra planeri]
MAGQAQQPRSVLAGVGTSAALRGTRGTEPERHESPRPSRQRLVTTHVAPPAALALAVKAPAFVGISPRSRTRLHFGGGVGGGREPPLRWLSLGRRPGKRQRASLGDDGDTRRRSSRSLVDSRWLARSLSAAV